MKKCKYCNLEKLEEDFEIANIINGKIYRRLKCSRCKQDRQNERRHEISKWIREYKKSHPCLICGFKDYRALCFHHRDPKIKEFEVSVYMGAALEKIKKEIEKCDVLCNNCHMILHYKEQ